MAGLQAAVHFLRGRSGPWQRGDTVIAAVAALAVLVRWSDRARFLMTWDAHTFALALERYDVNGLRPHAPGYPLYVALGRLSLAVTRDANEAYILLSLLFCALAAVLLYALGRHLVGRAAALAATAVLLCTPLLHVHAMTANVYAADLAASLAVACGAWWVRQAPSPPRIGILAFLFALAVGIRPSLGMFLLPLVAWAALAPPWTLGTQVRRLLPAALIGPTVGLAWFLPMARLSGGIDLWRRANSLQSEVVYEHPVWRDGLPIVQVNLERMALYLQWELRFVVPLTVAVVVLGFLVRGARRRLLPSLLAGRPLATFLLLWGVPPLLFYLTVYSGYGNGPSGYALILLPPLLLGAAALVRQALRALTLSPVLRIAGSLLALAVTLPGLVLHLHDVADIDYHEHDAWTAHWAGLPTDFPPSNTSIVTAYNFAHVWYYYPDYHAYEYRPAGKAVGEVPDFLMIQHAYQHEATPDWYDEIADHKTAGPHPLEPGVEKLILFDFQLAGENRGERQLRPEVPHHEAILPNGWRVLYVKVTPDKPNLEDYFTMEGAA